MIGPKAWDRIVTKFLSQGAAVAALGAVWVFNSRIFALNNVFVWKMSGMGCGSVPKHGTEIVGIFGDSRAVRDSPENCCGLLYGIYALNSIMVSIR